MNTMKGREQIVTVSSSGTYSTDFTLESSEIFVGVEFPAMDDGAIGLQYSRDNGTNWRNVLDPADGDSLLVVKLGSDPGIIDISDYIRFAHPNKHHKMRFTCAEQTSGAVSIVVLTKG